MVPSIWRQELWHVLSVHFPIALLLVGSASLFASLHPRFRWLFEPAAFVMLIAGVLGAWIAWYTGELAESIVNRVICDPTVTHRHQELAWWSCWAFSAGTLTLLWRRLRLLTVIFLLIGIPLLIQTGHTGASLVYQQGAGVYHPTPECKEFE